eukprot:scaffold220356_cov13-Prasinocladus_malaysianus.AAC.1
MSKNSDDEYSRVAELEKEYEMPFMNTVETSNPQAMQFPREEAFAFAGLLAASGRTGTAMSPMRNTVVIHSLEGPDGPSPFASGSAEPTEPTGLTGPTEPTAPKEPTEPMEPNSSR